MKLILFSEFLKGGANIDSIIVQEDLRIHLNHVDVSDGEVTIHDDHFDFGFIFDDFFIREDVDTVEFLVMMKDKYGSNIANTIVLKQPYIQCEESDDNTEVYGRSILEEVNQLLENLIDEQQRLRHEIESYGTRLNLAKQKIEEHLSIDRMVNVSTILEGNIDFIRAKNREHRAVGVRLEEGNVVLMRQNPTLLDVERCLFTFEDFLFVPQGETELRVEVLNQNHDTEFIDIILKEPYGE